ncbi:hypothetical protein X762_19640 [Mesorhizobium sp. LSHC426A00]|nr:hypothetical protein X762_19640 [Mesorhizobium sp. LSHC426A00]ESX56696.1 hypothetical protein X761_10695 [Mesorhizobium sp. LSHC424B00]ESX71501.1 hypothetical protein X758_15095 [Mesorhizobium sp. LSHC416B00]ESY48878.1 hypothetical protein X746_07820 [Mesorhizobium sp. LNJC380A00]
MARELGADGKDSSAELLMGKLAHMPPDPKTTMLVRKRAKKKPAK